MVSTTDLADALGRKEMASALGIGKTAISNAVVRGWFPSSWYLAVKFVAKAAGQECPSSLFRMRPIDSQYLNTCEKNQPRNPSVDL